MNELGDTIATMAEFDAFLTTNTQVDQIYAAMSDMNGVLRGKSVPAASAKKIVSGGLRLPYSMHGLNIWGQDVDATGLALEIGDPDGVLVPISQTLGLTPGDPKSAQILCELVPMIEGSSPKLSSPRQILKAMLEKFAADGLRPVAAIELEFYLFREEGNIGIPSSISGKTTQRLTEIDALIDQRAFLNDVRDACAAQNMPIDTLLAEYGDGQFEINFIHTDDLLNAADQALLFKHLVRQCAKNHGLRASFMAKPLSGQPGSGMHVHMSMNDENQRNIFASDDGINPKLLFAVAGALKTMTDFQAIFAPHANSYRRFQKNGHAPTSVSWGFDHRGVAVRIPEKTGKNARLEHRICGADVNVYLALSAILAGVGLGLAQSIEPQIDAEDPSHGLTSSWQVALENFERSEIVTDTLGPEYKKIYLACRNDEIEHLAQAVPDTEYDAYFTRL